MNHDIPQPVPQGSDRTQDTENSRILAVADELRRRCKLYEAELRDSTKYVNRVLMTSLMALVGLLASCANKDRVMTCPRCEGGGYVVVLCPDCEGRGKEACDNCAGEGVEECSACRGMGGEQCARCLGTGFVACSVCDGMGYQECETCNGQGTVTKPCEDCGGTGEARVLSN